MERFHEHREVPGEGTLPCRIMICGERPGWTEVEEGRPFVGPAGDELWDRLWRICRLDRASCYVTNLVKSFSTEPPTKAEIARYVPWLRSELRRCQPEIIITIGYHATRWFLPEFANVDGDYFHGLVFPYRFGHQRGSRARIVVPVIHSAAALRVPSRYQNQLSADLSAVAAVLSHEGPLDALFHLSHVPVPHRVELAAFGRVGQTIGIDTEFGHGRVQALSLAVNDYDTCCLEIPRGEHRWNTLASVLRNAKALVSHMAKAEYHSLHRLGIDLDGVRMDDTMLMAYLLGLPQSLKVLAYRELGWRMAEYADLVNPIDERNVRKTLDEAYHAYTAAHAVQAVHASGEDPRHPRRHRKTSEAASAAVPSTRIVASLKRILGKESVDPLRARWSRSKFAPLVPLLPPPTWEDVSEAKRIRYALTDPMAHLAIRRVLWPRLLSCGLRQVYEIDRRVLPMLVRMEQIGMACDRDALAHLTARFQREFVATCRHIDQLAGYAVNPLSGAQVSECLFGDLGVRPTRPTRSGAHRTTADKYLKARRNEHRIVPLILSARQLNKYLGTYTKKLPGLLRNERYHMDWRYTATATGRLAETIIVLIPKHDPMAAHEHRPDRAKAIRDCFHATEGNRLVSADLSQIELRVMAHLSRDERLLSAYGKGVDLHAQVAHDLLGAPEGRENQDESKHRLPIKTFHFSIINGTTEYGLLDQLHEQGLLSWDLEQVRGLLKDWFRLHKGVDRFWSAQKAHARRYGYVTDMFGRRRELAAIRSTNAQIRNEAERQALFAVQASADGISKIWNRRIWERLIRPRHQEQTYYCEPWVREHDATTLEVDREIAGRVAREMLAFVPDLLLTPTTAEARIGQQWGSLERLTSPPD